MHDVYVIRAKDIPGKIPVTFVKVYTSCCGMNFFYGETNHSGKSNDPDYDPTMHNPIKIPAIRAETLQFELYEKGVLKSTLIGEGSLIINQNTMNKPVNIDVSGTQLVVQVNSSVANYEKGTWNKKNENLFIFPTFSPPMPNNTYKLQIFGYDKKNGAFQQITESTDAAWLKPGRVLIENKETQVFRVLTKKIPLLTFVPVIVLDGKYVGEITLNFIASSKDHKKKETKMGDLMNIKNIFRSSIHVDRYESAVFNCQISCNKNNLLINDLNIENIATRDIPQQIQAIAKLILPKGINVQRRLEISLGRPYSLIEACQYHGVHPPASIKVDLGWMTETDLDASCCIFDSNINKIGSINFVFMEAFDGALKLSGDNIKGSTKGDDEIIEMNLGMLPPEVQIITISITSYDHVPFSKIEGFLKVLDAMTNYELMYLPLQKQQETDGLLFATLIRVNDDQWNLCPCLKYFVGNAPDEADLFAATFLKDSGFVDEMLASANNY